MSAFQKENHLDRLLFIKEFNMNKIVNNIQICILIKQSPQIYAKVL